LGQGVVHLGLGAHSITAANELFFVKKKKKERGNQCPFKIDFSWEGNEIFGRRLGNPFPPIFRIVFFLTATSRALKSLLFRQNIECVCV